VNPTPLTDAALHDGGQDPHWPAAAHKTVGAPRPPPAKKARTGQTSGGSTAGSSGRGGGGGNSLMQWLNRESAAALPDGARRA